MLMRRWEGTWDVLAIPNPATEEGGVSRQQMDGHGTHESADERVIRVRNGLENDAERRRRVVEDVLALWTSPFDEMKMGKEPAVGFAADRRRAGAGSSQGREASGQPECDDRRVHLCGRIEDHKHSDQGGTGNG